MTSPDGSQAHFVAAFGGERAQVLETALDDGWLDYQAASGSRAFRLGRTRHNVYWDYTAQRLEERFEVLAGVRRHYTRHLQLWDVDEFWAVRLKAHDGEFKTRNVWTRQQRLIRNTGYVPKLGHRVIVEIGPRPDPTWSNADELIASRSIGNQLEWLLDLRNLAAGLGATPTVIPRLDLGRAGVPEVGAKVKRSKGSKSTASGEDEASAT